MVPFFIVQYNNLCHELLIALSSNVLHTMMRLDKS